MCLGVRNSHGLIAVSLDSFLYLSLSWFSVSHFYLLTLVRSFFVNYFEGITTVQHSAIALLEVL